MEKQVNTLEAKITIGKNIGYSQKQHSTLYVIETLQKRQNKLIKKGLYLSASVKECLIVCGGQVEPHVELSVINYPKFPLSPKKFKQQIIRLTKKLMRDLSQNRVVVVFTDKTVMIENTARIDPRISKGK